MPIDVIMPQMGESVAEGTILKWLVHEGDHVEKEQPIVEISTDKIDTEVPASVTGVIKKILYPEGKTVPVRTVIAHLEAVEQAEGADISEEKLKAAKAVGKAKVPEEIEKAEEKERRYSPLVRKLAQEYAIKLEEVKGTGEGGRVTKKDVMDYMASKAVTPAPSRTGGETKVFERETLIPFNPRRKITADRMVQSKRTAAHVTTVFEIDMTSIERYRELHKDALKREEIHLTYLPFITLATARALKEHPLLNSSWTDEGIVQKNYYNIGIAVSLEDGLIVPVIQDADKKDLLQLAQEIQDLAQRSRTKRLKPEDVQGGTFTITNYGINGSLFGTPVIVLPQAAILGVGSVLKRPVVIADAIAIRSMMYLSLSFDHRIMDGANADMFLRRIKNILEGWEVSPCKKEISYEKTKSSPPA
ncbi:MAG: Dihydrolipoamide acyltransferase component of branched-chain alpha-keto acid dehydrogenase complex [Candidatus Jettenia ecosi]|uniref:Dihydrolipoamide acetyltransferase component of pyruvate dehydrogenase complex n=1 Tax=Candidatus Jettenia ecosi TaxID=2494326 RepID=A0A533Q9F4_9BACT|nr:MAG: Dihydrolipoamide acyltransferase component of branched-chain alpha-keto acid dehydrogenase complex [Candidatus Jettenia ecosi]